MTEQQLLQIEIKYPGMSQYAVAAKSVADFVRRYYKPERLHAVEGRAERIIADREFDMSKYGSAWISQHDSVTGTTVIYFG